MESPWIKGRGAQHNTRNRFLSQEITYDETLQNEIDYEPSLRTKVFMENPIKN